MRTAVLLGVALGLAGLLGACGGGGGTAAQASMPPSPPPPPPPPVQAWQAPVDLVPSGYASGAALAGDGKGGVVAAWIRYGTERGGTTYWEQTAARLRPDGTWETPQALEYSQVSNGFLEPVLSLDHRGKGIIGWLSPVPRSTVTALKVVPVDLTAAPAFGTPSTALQVGLRAPSDLRLAVGSDGSALAAWSGLRPESYTGGEFLTVQAARRDPVGGWGAPASYHLNQLAAQFLHEVASDGQGGYLLDYSTGDDAWVENEAVAFAPGTGTAAGVGGWGPASQVALPAWHPSVWAKGVPGNLETWLIFAFAGEGDAQRQAWPRRRNAAGVWTVGDKVSLPRPAQNLALFREASGMDWLAGLGAEGLWVAPLNGLTPGAARTILSPPTQTEVLVAARDAAGRPALLWIQRGIGGASEGIGFSRWDGDIWTTPSILPGTAGKGIQRLFAVAGPAGLLAAWVEVGDRVLLFRTALWR